MTEPQFVVGIDLGTTHCAMAAARINEARLHLLPVVQLIAPGEVAERSLLPSFLYLPAAGETTDAERALPWGAEGRIVGEYARRRGAKSPNRLVASAKSWVCHGGVNRRAAILPWSAPDQEEHVSPFDAQVAYLAHLARVWHLKYPGASLAEQDVVVTVPASFDEGARSLTMEAAAEAGLGSVRLIEEPQAAFYDYLGSRSTAADDAKFVGQLENARLILVVDIGGGTTDLTLLRVQPETKDAGGLPAIERIAVGGHLMLGGDNMDAALAMFALNKAKMPRPEDASVWSALVQSARNAKEVLLGESAPEEAVISVQGRGSRLIAKTKSIVIRRKEALAVLLDGCFPLTGPEEVAQATARAGLTTLGLPYSNDTAVPRHVCSFLRRHASAASLAGAEVQDGLPRPDLLLLNGGVFKAPAAIERFKEVLAGWYGDAIPQFLEHTSLDTSVAQGAARFALARHGVGSLIEGGTAKAYYIGIDRDGARQALCVAPRGLEEGSRSRVPDRLFQLRLNQAVEFPLYAYSGDRVDPPGHLIDPGGEEDALESLSPLRTLLRGKRGAEQREDSLAVSLESRVDERGALILELVSAELPPRRFKLEFAVQGAEATPEPAREAEDETAPEQKLEADPQSAVAARMIESAFASSREEKPKELRRELEEKLGPRGQWSAALCRAMADLCITVEAQRGQSVVHELNWLRLLSWCLRPGFGVSGDMLRIDALWALRDVGLRAPNKGNWSEWWILWRRCAGGLSAERQQKLFAELAPSFWPTKGGGAPLQGAVEMMRLMASLERISVESKMKTGALFLERAKKLGSYWPVGRAGARVPLQSQGASLVPAATAEKWLKALLDLDWQKEEGASFAAATLARLTGEAHLDVSSALRSEVLKRLAETEASPHWTEMVQGKVGLGTGDLKRILGDSLPVGLSLVES